MHEYSIVQAMFDQIESQAARRQAIAVKRVCVRIGRAAGVDVPLLKTAYDTFRVKTICEQAPLEVEEIPERWSCPEGHGDIPPGRRLTCDQCGKPATMASGDEIVLERLELEVP
ncbi:MAG: hydrogenase maturation nickel metallochaperone HypA [Acidobacteria bacterium]|nr:hydrogenase maturation nickel metallochaperone HypA [Acidobacteriota bacterium]